MNLDDYQKSAIKTDTSVGDSASRYLLLGLFGEAGSVLSIVKKQDRDRLTPQHYFSLAMEEIGDLLWYLAVVAHHDKLTLGKIAKPLALPRASRLAASKLGFGDLQEPRMTLQVIPSKFLEWALVDLADSVGKLVVAQRTYLKKGEQKPLLEAFTEVVRRLVIVGNRAGVSLEEAARKNLAKTAERWPETRETGYPPQFDAGFPSYERLPHQMKIDIIQISKSEDQYFVYQSCNGINIGDRLTDNIEFDDNYRFHDVFHYAYAAVIGWSPVLRSILKRKRKSVAKVDESEDGARAILIEEGISALVFNEAKSDGTFFSNVERGKLSFDLLKTIKIFVRGYEVEHVPYWVWEEAILQGYEAFRYLVKHGRGRIVLDYKHRRITAGPIP
ncbi:MULTISPECIES: nucleoside triphosphate pyrophosphohydrolase family protein [unclassified Sphingopyxis]|uniref:nucleoside triphosphate pyrophosphohydrolase family protein n=1 Tax=unclassified Sphingopyxis TaxID=2614943 RepID=UPI0009EBAC62|nr:MULTISPECIES: nucleoside triphosphate pyrophosphohydrolase family protein [unclassified Sphingopyxis]